MFVMTVDQKASRRGPDRVGHLLDHFRDVEAVRGFDRTAGDEAQAVFDDPELVVDVALQLVRDGHWSIGIGCGAVEQPLPAAARAGRGQAFILARDAVNRAKQTSGRVAVAGVGPAAEEADALLALLADVVQRRSEPGWQALDLTRQGLTQTQVAERLGVTKQAISARLRTAMASHESRLRPLVAKLLSEAADE